MGSKGRQTTRAEHNLLFLLHLVLAPILLLTIFVKWPMDAIAQSEPRCIEDKACRSYASGGEWGFGTDPSEIATTYQEVLEECELERLAQASDCLIQKEEFIEECDRAKTKARDCWFEFSQNEPHPVDSCGSSAFAKQGESDEDFFDIYYKIHYAHGFCVTFDLIDSGPVVDPSYDVNICVTLATHNGRALEDESIKCWTQDATTKLRDIEPKYDAELQLIRFGSDPRELSSVAGMHYCESTWGQVYHFSCFANGYIGHGATRGGSF